LIDANDYKSRKKKKIMTDRFNSANLEVKREPDMQGVGSNSPSSTSVQVKNERLNGYPDDGGGGTSGDTWASHDQQCCLVDNGRRCTRVAGNASYNKRIQKTVAQKKLKLHMDNSARHIYICDFHKSVIQNLRTKRKRKDSEDSASGETDSEHPEVDLFQLQVNTLRRYKKHYKVPVRQGLNKAQLADSMTRHFKTIPVAEKEALTYFIYMVKTNKSKLDRDRRDGIDAD